MKSRLLLIVSALFAITFFAAAVQAQTKEKRVVVKMAVINVDTISRNAAVSKDIRRQIIAFRNAFRADIQKEEVDIRNANQELARQRAILTPEAFTEERRKFEQRLMEVQRKVQERKQALDGVRDDARKTLQDTLNKIVVKLANENELTLIIRSDQAVFWAKQLDITKEVLKRLDAQLPSLKVAVPGQ